MANKDEQTLPYSPYGYAPHGHPASAHPAHGYPCYGHAPYGYPAQPHDPAQYYASAPTHPHAGYQPVPPPYYYNHPAQMIPPHMLPPHGHGHAPTHAPDSMWQQSQHMLEGLMGEQAGVFKDLMHKLGVDDKEFWKGAMIGAAAALVLSNEQVRGNLLSLFGNAGELLKTGGDKVRSAASNVGDNVAMGGNVIRDTFASGQAGFKESVARQHPAPTEMADDPAASTESSL